MAGSGKPPPPEASALPGGLASPGVGFAIDETVRGAVRGLVEAAAPNATSLCVALSGGMDSVVLLHATHAVFGGARSLAAIHVHHGISPHADAWANFCVDACARLDIPIVVERVSIDPWRAFGIEAAARAARYEAFGKVSADALLLAHHEDDQAETLLVQLLRGAGPTGLAGMPPARARAHEPLLLRPFLPLPRDVLAAWARSRDLTWVEDESNASLRFRRNRMRHEVMPLLRSIEPRAAGNLARSARHLAEAGDLLRELAREDRLRLAARDGIAASGLCAMGASRAANALRGWAQDCGLLMPSAARLDEFLRQLREAQPESNVAMRVPGYALRCWRDAVHLVLDAGPIAPGELPDLRHGGEWPVTADGGCGGGLLVFVPADRGGIAASHVQSGRLSIRARGPGDRIRPTAGARSKTLKNLFQEAQVPPWERNAWPVVDLGGRCVCVPGLAVDATVMAGPDEPGVQLHWHPSSRVPVTVGRPSHAKITG